MPDVDAAQAMRDAQEDAVTAMQTGKPVPPNNPWINLAATSAQAQANITNNLAGLARAKNNIDDATAADVQAAQDFGKFKQMQVAAEDGFQADTDATKKMYLAAFGANPDDAANRLIQLKQVEQDSFDKGQVILDRINEQQGYTIFNNPLGWIQSRFTLPADTAAYNVYKDRHDNAQAEFINTAQALTEVGRMTDEMQQKTSAAALDGKLGVIAAQAAELKAQAIIRGATAGADILSRMNATNLEDITAAKARTDLLQQQQSMAAQAQHMSLEKTMKDLQVLMLNEKTATLQDKNDLAANNAKIYNTAAAYYKVPQLDQYTLDKRLKAGDPKVMSFFNVAQRYDATNNDPGSTLINESPTLAANFLKTLNVATPTGTTAPTIQYLEKTLADPMIQQSVNTIRDPKEKIFMLDDQIRKKAMADQYGVDSNDTKNPYAAFAPAALTKALPDLLENPFISGTIMKLQEATPTSPISDTTIIKAAQAAIAKDPTQYNVIADGINRYYAGVLKANIALKGFKTVGLPEQSSYMAKINTGTFGSAQVKDLTNPSVVRMLLLSPAAMGITPFGIGSEIGQP